MSFEVQFNEKVFMGHWVKDLSIIKYNAHCYVVLRKDYSHVQQTKTMTLLNNESKNKLCITQMIRFL